MATSSKFDLPSSSPDRPFYTSNQRDESLTIPSLERSSSFRGGSTNPVLPTFPNMGRTGSAVTMAEVVNFVQNVHFEPKLVSGDSRCQRLMCSVFGVQPDDSLSCSLKGKLVPSSSWEDLKRAKAIVREGSIRARERLKVFHDTVSAFNKYLPNAHSRKRSRSEVLSSERSGSSSSGDRSLLGLNGGKRVAQGTAVSNVFDHGQQKSEIRTKNDVPNKRTRTSLADIKVDMRNFNHARPVESIERNRDTPRLVTTGPVSGDIIPSVSVPGWEKSRMKKKRSAIKADGSSSAVSKKNNEDCYDTKQDLQQMLISNSRSRLQNSQGLRPGNANGTAKGNTSLRSTINVGYSVPETDHDEGSPDWRDLNVSTDNERMNIKSINKPASRNDFNSASPTSSSKLSASARAPRSGFVAAPKSTSEVNRVAISNEWELSNCSNNLPVPFETGSMHASSARSSSPPAHWAGQRSKKNFPPTRKASFLSISPRNDDIPTSELISDVAGTKHGLEFERRALGDLPKQIKLKGDHLSSTPLSESEDSANPVIKFIDKKFEEQDEKPGHNIKKISPLVPPERKNKLVNEKESDDVIRRQGRTARGLTPGRSLSLLPMNIEKLANVGTAKQLRTAKLGLEKSESKAGRQPSRKLSDRKAYTRQKHSSLNSATDFLVGSDDCTEELVAAAQAVTNPCHAQSSAFWKRMETYFHFISDNDIAFLRQQENQWSFLLSTNAVNVDYSTVSNGCKNDEGLVFTNETKYAEAGTDHLASPMRLRNETTLCQRLLAALIPEEEWESLDSENEDLIDDAGLELDEGFGSNILNRYLLESFQLDACATTDGYMKSSTRRPLDRLGHYMAQSPVTPMSNYGHLQNGNLKTNEMVPFLESSDLEYDNMTLDRRILLEIESAKLFSEGLLEIAPPEEDEILTDINCLVEKYHRQVAKKDKLISDLLKVSTNVKEIQEKDFEARALDQLVGMSYGQYMASRRLRGSATSKVIKQAALAFSKRTLERCHTYEVTGTSCFSEPPFFDKFLSMSSFTETQSADTATEGESARHCDINSNGALEPRASVSIASQQSPSLTSWSGHNLDNMDIYSSDMPQSGNLPSELPGNKDDAWSNSRVKKRELLLNEVGRSGIGNTLSSSTKGKRSGRDKEGKSHGREALYSHGTVKTGRPSISNPKAERKPKAKPKQRTTQLSASVNDLHLLGKLSEQPRVSLSRTGAPTIHSVTKEKDKFSFDETEPIDLSGLQIPGMDVLGAPDDLSGQGEDIESWLNIEDDGLQDLDFLGLEIPMDDLSELNMMV